MGLKEYAIAFTVSGKLAGTFNDTFAKAGDKIGKFERQIEAMNKASSDLESLIGLREEGARLAKDAANKKKALDAVSESIRRTANPTKEQLELEKRLTKAYGQAKKTLDRNTDALKKNELAASHSGESIQKLTARQERYATVTQRLVKIQQRSTQAQKTLDSYRAKSSAGFANALEISGKFMSSVGMVAKEAMHMEDAMAEVAKVVNFDEPDGLSKLQKDLQRMSLSIPISAAGLANIAAAAGQSGIAAKDLTEFTRQAAQMGVAFGVTAEEAGTMMAKWKSGMALTSEETYRLADAVNYLSNSNAAQAKEIGDTLQRYGALGRVAGLTSEQTAALSASVIAAGASADMAATGIKAMMRALGLGGSMADRQAAAFSNVGMDPMQMQKALQKDAPATIVKTLKAIQTKVPKEMWNQYLNAMFGDEAATAVGPMMQNLEALEENFAKVADKSRYAGSMLAEFKARSATTSNALALVANTAKYVGQILGEPLLKPIKDISLYVVKVASRFGQWAQENQTLVTWVMKGAAAYGIFRLAMAGVSAVVYAGLARIKSLGVMLLAAQKAMLLFRGSALVAAASSKVFTAAAVIGSGVMKGMTLAAKGLGVALRFLCLNPIGLAVTAIAGLVAAGVALYKNWDTVKAYMSQTWAAIAAAAKSPINSMIGMINSLIDAINGLLSFKVPDWVPGVGGKSMSVEIPKVPQLAEGGVATGPTLAMVGEGREPEAILPLSRLPEVGGGRGPTSVSVNFAPVINLTGGKDAYEGVRRGLSEGSKSLKQELERLLADERRLSFS